MTAVILVRHGQTISNVTGFYMGWSQEDLNDAGYAQARRLSLRLAGLPIASIYTSPLRRAYATAALLAEPHRLEPQVLDDLIEIRLGDWQGLYADEIKRRWPELWRRFKTDPSGLTMPNGESFAEVTEWAIRAFDRVVGASQDRLALAVTHDVIVRILVAHVLGVTNSIYRQIEAGNASLTMIGVSSNQPRLVRLNDTSHLEG